MLIYGFFEYLVVAHTLAKMGGQPLREFANPRKMGLLTFQNQTLQMGMWCALRAFTMLFV